MSEFSREQRVADFVRDNLADIIRSQMRDPRVGMVSVNDVKVSKDFSYAEVYVSSLQSDSKEERGELIQVLNRASGFLRTHLSKRHTMRSTPQLRFHYDELVEKGPRLEKLIDEAVAIDKQRDSS